MIYPQFRFSTNPDLPFTKSLGGAIPVDMFHLDLPKQLQKYTLLSQESVVAEVENCEFLKGHSGRRNLTNADVRAEKSG